MLTIVAIISGIASLLPMMPFVPTQSDPVRCTIVAVTGLCLVEAADPGRPGGPQDTAPRRPAEGRSRETAASPGAVGPPPPPPPPRVELLPVIDGGGFLPRVVPDIDIPVPVPVQVPAGPVVSPAVLAQRAIEELALQAPAPELSATGLGYVGVPLWLWIGDGVEATGPVSATAAAGASEVTATGQLTGMEWQMGPPGALVRCAGTGTPWTGQPGPSPDCGYTYALRSTPERTGGGREWLITVTAVWDVTWAGVVAGVPVAGEQTVRLTTEESLAVGEVQVLVSERGGTLSGGGR